MKDIKKIEKDTKYIPTPEQEEQKKRDEEAEADMDRFWEIGSDTPERR